MVITPGRKARHLGSQETLVMCKYKTAEGLQGHCKQAMPATLQVQGKRALAPNEAAHPLTLPQAPLGVLLTQF